MNGPPERRSGPRQEAAVSPNTDTRSLRLAAHRKALAKQMRDTRHNLGIVLKPSNLEALNVVELVGLTRTLDRLQTEIVEAVEHVEHRALGWRVD